MTQQTESSNFFLPFLWRMPGNAVYLTFDDGPDPDHSTRILDILKRYQIQATFFVIGEKTEKHPDIVARMIAEGHTVGNHTHTHPHLVGKTKEMIRREIEKTDFAIQNITSKKPCLFRPPYGQFGLALLQVLKATDHRLVLWNQSVKDYKKHANASTITKRLNTVHSGQIVLLHDGHKNSPITATALELTLEHLMQSGIRFAPLNEKVN